MRKKRLNIVEQSRPLLSNAENLSELAQEISISGIRLFRKFSKPLCQEPEEVRFPNTEAEVVGRAPHGLPADPGYCEGN